MNYPVEILPGVRYFPVTGMIAEFRNGEWVVIGYVNPNLQGEN